MLQPDDPWFVADDVEDSDELLRALPEIRQGLETATDEELGLRSLLERPDLLSHAWWRDQASKSGRTHATFTPPRAA